MNILSKLFKKRQQPESSDNIKIVIKTDKELSEEQINTIHAIVKNGTKLGASLSDIGMNIMLGTGIYDLVILNRIKDGVEVTF